MLGLGQVIYKDDFTYTTRERSYMCVMLDLSAKDVNRQKREHSKDGK